MRVLLLSVSLALGAVIAYVDSRPNWDDAGVSAGAIFIACAALGAASPRLAWLWALAVGGWIPLRGIALGDDWGMLVVLVFAFAGAYAGVGLRKAIEFASRAAA